MKEFAGMVESFATTAAIVLGGYWTYMLFISRRQKYPRASISHAIHHMPINHNNRLVHVATTVSNAGEVLLPLVHVRCWMQQLTPVPDSILSEIACPRNPVPDDRQELPWPLIGGGPIEWTFSKKQAEIEPGESEVLHSEFIIDSEVETALVYSYVKNPVKRNREIGWSHQTILTLTEESRGVTMSKPSDKQMPPKPPTPAQVPPKPIPTEHTPAPTPSPQAPPKEPPPPPKPPKRG